MKKYIIYISIPKKYIIEVFKFNSLGSIKKIQEIYTNGEVQPLKLCYKKKLLYAGVRNDSRIITYKINKKGLLKLLKETKTIGDPNHIFIDKNEKYLFNSSYGGNSISFHFLNKKGIPEKLFKNKKNILGCHSSVLDIKNNFLFCSSLKMDKIFIYSLKKIKKIFKKEKNILKCIKKSGPRHIIIHPKNKYLYIIHELNSSISIWNIKKIFNDNKIKCIQKIDILNIKLKKNWAADIHFTPCGNFLYASERIYNSITLFQVNSNTGKIKLIKIYKTEIQPRSFKIDNTGKYLIISGQKSNSISIYKINKKNGFLKKEKSFNTMKEPLWVEILQLI
ncbi:6-phosphogluconolactonase [Buchnera aphidicola (Periphyllus testudinaceus)]|uniref:beta-propeller fold lactonase family protein n=1 Tax=Buchnera aphidicola TaxID=9 RepID=UPI003464BADD